MLKGGEDLLYLISHSFDGVMLALINPLIKVNNYTKHRRYSSSNAVLR